MSVKDYFLKLTQIFRYTSTMVPNSRYRMNNFVTGVCFVVEEKCLTTMHHNDINISKLMLNGQKIKVSKLRKIYRD